MSKLSQVERFERRMRAVHDTDKKNQQHDSCGYNGRDKTVHLAPHDSGKHQ